MIDYRKMDPSEVVRSAEIDRSEQMTVGYVLREGKLGAKDIHMFMKF
jgi:hypothetical protein